MAQKRKSVKYYINENGDMVISRKKYVRSGNTEVMHNIKCQQRITVVEQEGVYCERILRVGERIEVYCIGYLWKPTMNTIVKNRYPYNVK